MQYLLNAGKAPDLTAIADAIAALDPAALVDLDPHAHTVRIATVATERELLDGLRVAGLAVGNAQLARVPSECCGGCGG